jgi:hypothetical protein
MGVLMAPRRESLDECWNHARSRSTNGRLCQSLAEHQMERPAKYRYHQVDGGALKQGAKSRGGL